MVNQTAGVEASKEESEKTEMLKKLSILKAAAASFAENASTFAAGMSTFREIQIDLISICENIKRETQRQHKDLQRQNKELQRQDKDLQRLENLQRQNKKLQSRKEEVNKTGLTISTIRTEMTELQREIEGQNRQRSPEHWDIAVVRREIKRVDEKVNRLFEMRTRDETKRVNVKATIEEAEDTGAIGNIDADVKITNQRIERGSDGLSTNGNGDAGDTDCVM